MPTYSYKCSECSHQFDIMQKMSDEKLTDCPSCKKEGSLSKLITAGGGFQLKGKGWFGNSKTTKGY